MERAVVAYDFSPHARRALGLALQGFPFGSKRVEVFHACDERIFQEGLPNSEIPTLEELQGVIESDVEEVRKSLPTSENATLEVYVAAGCPWERILEYMGSVPDTALFLGGQGHGGFHGSFLGRTVQHILRRAKFPVYVVKNDSSEVSTQGVILCAVDYAEPSRYALEEAARIARVRDEKLAVLHVVDNRCGGSQRKMERCVGFWLISQSGCR